MKICIIKLLMSSLIIQIQITTTQQACINSCQSMTHKTCVENKTPIVRHLDMSFQHLCYQVNTCFGGNDTSNLPVQQIPLTMLQDQNLYLNISTLLLNNFTINIFNSTMKQHFDTCDFTKSIQVLYSLNSENLIHIPRLKPGLHYLIFKTTNLLYRCQYGLRMQINVYQESCLFTNSTSCSSNGQCSLNNNNNAFQCDCCEEFHGQHCEEYNDCYNNTCLNNSTCVDIKNGIFPSGFNCSCMPQFTGQLCDSCIKGFAGADCKEDLDECHLNKTICNYGNCTNKNGSFGCLCPVNVTGTYCETDFYDNCISNTCSNQSTCIDQYGTYMCDCQLGFTGKYCRDEINECSMNACSVEGTSKCIDQVGNYTCECIPGFSGHHCEIDKDECLSKPCLNQALCINLINTYSCICQPGYDGNNCENLANKCQVLQPCSNNSTCKRTGNNLQNYTCLCEPGWTGQNCTIEINECNLKLCENNSTCIDLFNNFTCMCEPSWTGKLCDVNINACLSTPCENNATCVDLQTNTDYNCICPAGFTSKNCSININDCKNISCNNGECMDLINDFKCKCYPGWYGDYCETNQDLCSFKPCLNSNTCKNVNTTQGYQCICKTGFTGRNCLSNIDDCMNHKCLNGGVCNDLINTYNCTCPPGFNGQYCEIDKNECLTNPCLNNATCKDLINQYYCECKSGFNGTQCENNINECIPSPCVNNSSCVDLINDFSCQCNIGFISKTCAQHLCDVNTTCENNGKCLKTNTNPGYNCSCLNGFTGSNCEISVNECLLSPCQHNGSCIDLLGSFKCNCTYPFYGTQCEYHVCSKQLCENNSTCIETPIDYICQCKPGITGRNCSVNINDCINNNCSVNGTLKCVDKLNTYDCLCHQGYYGNKCNTSICNIINICNNGTCLMNKTNYSCICNPGFTGANCSINADDCQNITCGEGQCIDGINNFTCVCPALKRGKFCEKDLDFCKQKPCMNNATCSNIITNETFHCDCEFPYSGEICNIHICNTPSLCNHGECMATPTNFTCSCKKGFTGRFCEVLIGNCKATLCQNGGNCSNSINNFTCTCQSNFTGRYCESLIDYCEENRCVNNASCYSNRSAMNYTCQCKPGFIGSFCQLDQCLVENPCENNSTCYKTQQGIKCLCLKGYTSLDCSTKINYCNVTPCKNNGTCVNTLQSYTCQCKQGFTGIECETELGPCFSRNCSDNGNCVPNDTASYCNCYFGYHGNNCQNFICPCLNNGRCFRQDNQSQYKCKCNTNYTGITCETYIGDCQTNTSLQCSHESYCKLSNHGYACLCPAHLQGDYCEIFAGCRNTTCKNNATCTEHPIDDKYSCQCLHGFNGSRCEFDVNECLLHPCKNNGVCTEEGFGRYRCHCNERFTGLLCDLPLTVSSTKATSLFKTAIPTKATIKTYLKSSVLLMQSSVLSQSNVASRMLSNTSLLRSPMLSTNIKSTSMNKISPSSKSVFQVTTSTSTYLPTNIMSSASLKASTKYLSTQSNSVIPSLTHQSVASNHSLVLSTKSMVSRPNTVSLSVLIVVSTILKSSAITALPSKVSISATPSKITFVTTTSSLVTTEKPTLTPVPTTPSTSRPFLNLTCDDSPCNGFTCYNEIDNGLNFRCACPFPTVAPRCTLDTVIHYPRFNGFSYIITKPFYLNETKNSIVVAFHTTKTNGLILYANHTEHEDYFKMELDNGFLKVSLNTGGGESMFLTSTMKIDTGNMIIAKIDMNSINGLVSMSINDTEDISQYMVTSLKSIDLTSPWYFGSIPNQMLNNFTGCIRDVQINDQPIKLTDPLSVLSWFSISDCEISACARGACYNNAECTPDVTNLQQYECKCRPGYFGETCQQKIEHCIGDPCHGGICVWTQNGRQCLCQYGRIGDGCLIESVISTPKYTVFANYSSYIEYPWLNTGRFAFERFEIRLQFKLSPQVNMSTDGLMVYMAQSTIGASSDDFFVLGILDNYIYVIYNLGSGLAIIKSIQPININRNWHFLVAGRSLHHGYLYLNSQPKITGTSPGSLSGLDVFTPLYIGGVPDFNQIPSVLKPYFKSGFNGLIHDAAIRTNSPSFVSLLTLTKNQISDNMVGIAVEEGRNINNDNTEECKDSPCVNNGTCLVSGSSFICICKPPYKGPYCISTQVLCVDYNPCSVKSSCRADGFDVKCDCPFGLTGMFCSQKRSITTPYFSENSFITVNKVNIRSSFLLTMKFKPSKADGLLFYTSHSIHTVAGDFLAISLWKRYVYIRFNLGTHTVSMRSRQKITLDTWSTIYVRRLKKDAIMKINNNAMIGGRSSGQMTMLDVGTHFYVGGVPYLSNINKAAVKDVTSQYDFNGCIAQLQVNEKVYVLNSSNPSLIGRNIQDCSTNSCKQPRQCQNNGICLSNSSTECSCPLGFVGRYCQIAIGSMTSAYFNSMSYWYTRFEESDLERSHYEFSFKAVNNVDDGLILWHGFINDVTNFLAVGLSNGRLNTTFSLNGVLSSAITSRRYDNNIFHRLIMDRIGNTVQFFVNGHTPQIISLVTTTQQLKTYGYFYIGGFPEKGFYEGNGKLYGNGFIGCISNVTLSASSTSYIEFVNPLKSKGNNLQIC